MLTVRKFMPRAVAAVAFTAALSPLALAQGGEVEKATRGERERRAAEDARRLASWELRLLEQRRGTERPRDQTLAYAQIREDYKQIQVANNELARSVSAGGALDFKHVAKSAAEIKKRAGRLKENLMLPEGGAPSGRVRPEAGAEAEGLKAALALLDELVLEFVNNPIFEQAKTSDVRMAAKARRALEEIVEVSERVKKGSESLQKLARKGQ